MVKSHWIGQSAVKPLKIVKDSTSIIYTKIESLMVYSTPLMKYRETEGIKDAGLSECVWRMKGCSHTAPKGKEFGLRVMQHMNDKCTEWRYGTYDYELAFSLYGTPMLSMGGISERV